MPAPGLAWGTGKLFTIRQRGRPALSWALDSRRDQSCCVLSPRPCRSSSRKSLGLLCANLVSPALHSDLPPPHLIPSSGAGLRRGHGLLRPWTFAQGLPAWARLALDKFHIPSSNGCFLCSLKVMPPGKASATIDFHKSTKIPGPGCPVLLRALKRRPRKGVGIGGALGVSPFTVCVQPQT